MTRSEAIARHIAAAIVRNQTRKHWSGLHSDAISALEREIIMSTPTTSNNHTAVPQAQPATGRPADLQPLAQKQAPAQPANGPRPNNVVSQVGIPVARPVDRRTIEGSTPGDFRKQPGDVARASVDPAADNGGPREPMRQSGMNSSKLDAPAPVVTATALDSDAGN